VYTRKEKFSRFPGKDVDPFPSRAKPPLPGEALGERARLKYAQTFIPFPKCGKGPAIKTGKNHGNTPNPRV
jgi:hypothetical protein